MFPLPIPFPPHLPFILCHEHSTNTTQFTPIAFHLTSSSPSSPPLITTLTPHLSPPTKPLPLRLGTTTTLRNTLLALPSPTTSIPPLIPYILPALLLPLIGPDPPFTEAETELLPPECQYLGPEQVREGNTNVLHGVVEVIFLLAVRGGREVVEGMKGRGVYPVLREAHLGVEDEGVREVVERCVQALMGEEGDEGKGRQEGGRVEEVGEKDGKGHGGKREKSGDSDEEKIVEVF